MHQPNELALIEFRKYNYWRGFRVALYLTVPIIAVLMLEVWQLLNLTLNN